MKLSHLLHPFRSLRSLRAMLARRAERSALLRQGQRRYRGDPRYHTDRVAEGFAPRPMPDRDDAALLERICTAYIRAIAHQTPGPYDPNDWWRIVRREHLGPVTQALTHRDIPALRGMYRNFFRDPCGAGLTGLPVNMARTYLSRHIKAADQRLFLIDALHQLDLWKSETTERFPLEDLRSPSTGNPFGITLNKVFVATGAAYHHFYAQRIRALLPSACPAAVLEIGGGYGGMAYYLLRDNPGVTYVNFDLPESIALAAYYLMTALPEVNVTLYGEAGLTPRLLATPGIVLMPAFCLPELPDRGVDVSFTAHVLGDLPASAVHAYLEQLVRTTRRHFLHLDRPGARQAVAQYMRQAGGSLQLGMQRPALWNSAKSPRNDEAESLYTAADSFARAASSPKTVVPAI